MKSILNFFITLLVIIIFFYCFYLLDKLENFQNNQKTLQFIHIPKNAGTSIENLGYKFGIKWGRFIEREKYPLSEKPCDYYHWHSPYFIRQKNTKYFAIVRNPYDKIISEFYYVGGQKDERYASDNHLKSFYLWLEDKYKIIKSNKHWNNCHILPQHEYIFDSTGKKRIDHVVYMDKDFKENLDKLFKQYNLDIDIDELNKNNSREKTFSKNDINQNALNKINEMYKEDFEKLGFTKLMAGIENFTNKRDLDYYEDYYDYRINDKPCTKDTSRCSYSYTRDKKITSYLCCKNHLVEILSYLVKVLDDNNIEYFIDYGTLLGCARNKSFIPWDKDIDISIIDNPNLDKVMDIIYNNDKGYRLIKGNHNFYTLNFSKTNHLHADISIRTKQINDVYTDKYTEENWGIHKNDLFPLKNSKFENINVKIPFNTKKYLENGYGKNCITSPKTKVGLDSYQEKW